MLPITDNTWYRYAYHNIGYHRQQIIQIFLSYLLNFLATNMPEG